MAQITLTIALRRKDNSSRHVPLLSCEVDFGDCSYTTRQRELSIVLEQETDGRWLAEIPELPGVMAYGPTKNDAEVAVTALALRVIADRTEQVKKRPKSYAFCEQLA